METIRDLAIVVRAIRYQDRHKIITAVTQEHGMVTAIARNAVQSRRFGGTLELYTACEWIYVLKPQVELVQLKESTLKKSFDGLREDFKTLALASIFSEIIEKIVPMGQRCKEIFQLHANALMALSGGLSFELVAFLNLYMAKVLLWNGNQPRLESCLECQTVLFDLPSSSFIGCLVEKAGWICSKCIGSQVLFSKMSVPVLWDLYKGLQVSIRRALEQIQESKQQHTVLFHWLHALYVYHIPGFDQSPLKGLRFLSLEPFCYTQRGHNLSF